jgi:hypothetical protein
MVPIMFDTTSAVALTTPSCLRREGLLGADTLLFYRALTLDHQSVANAFDVEGRAKGLAGVLENSL